MMEADFSSLPANDVVVDLRGVDRVDTFQTHG
jgi:anti-anti-sigma regulatory factor